MRRFARILEALHESRRRKAERVICQYWRLVEEARAYDRGRAIRAAEKVTEAESAQDSHPELRLQARSA